MNNFCLQTGSFSVRTMDHEAVETSVVTHTITQLNGGPTSDTSGQPSATVHL